MSLPSASVRAPGRARRSRADRMTTAWMVVGLVVFALTIVGRTYIPQAWWLSIHILTLGVLTNAILQWSWYFSRSLLRLPATDVHSGRDQAIRQWAFNGVLIVLVVAMTAASFPLVLGAATGVGLLIAWHGVALVLAARSRLGSRFAVVIRYYVASAAFLVVGIVFGVLAASSMFQATAPSWIVEGRANLTLAHSLANFLGWLGLTIAGTLITLWPTMLRTRISPDAAARSTQALPLAVTGVLVSIAGASLGSTRAASLGVLVFLAAMTWGVGVPLLSELLVKKASGYATWSAGSGIIWVLMGLLALTIGLFLAPNPDAFRGVAPPLIAALGVGGALQILAGALTYLLPVVVGGGPSAVRVGIKVLERGALFRLTLRNSALVLALLAPSVAPVFWLLVVATFALDITLFGMDGVIQGRKKRENAALAGAVAGVGSSENE